MMENRRHKVELRSLKLTAQGLVSVVLTQKRLLHQLRYCCLLANPQNSDISALLNVPPMESPFAKAMQAASHVLVIPNKSIGIYTRLWCVYEAYLGTRWNKTCIMPARPHTATQCGTITRTALAPIAAGLLLGLLWWALLSREEVRDGFFLMVTTTMLACASGTGLCFLASIILKLCGCEWQRHYRSVRMGHALLLFLCTVSLFPWLRFKPTFSHAFDHFQHYFLPIVLCLFNLLRVAQLNQHQLELKDLHWQANDN